jgi:RHS repeat-associated protein
MRYWPYGATRSGALDTPYRYTGQREEPTGLYFYNARWYDPALGRFLQPDSMVPEPGNPQSLNRYSYALNNPLKYSDPTGHCVEMGASPIPCSRIAEEVMRRGPQVLQQIESLIVQYGPQVTQLLQQWGDKLGALVDKASQSANGASQNNSQAGNTGDPGQLDPNKWGRWVQRPESMSDRARAYQRYVTGQSGDQVFQIEGVNFDGLRDGVLLDAKGYYKQFVDPSTGTFKQWWRGAGEFVEQAQRQIQVARGVQIEWHFNEVETLEAVRRLFAEKGITSEVTLVLDQMP